MLFFFLSRRTCKLDKKEPEEAKRETIANGTRFQGRDKRKKNTNKSDVTFR